MIFADKLTDQRKKNGWTQEELADKLHVSRQAVSKWESARSIPDIDRIIDMADLFGVSTDYLLKDSIEDDGSHLSVTDTDFDGDVPLRRVSLEEANAYVDIIRTHAPRVALGIGLCIVSPIPLLLLGGFVSDNAAGIAGVPILLLLVAIAVGIFRFYGQSVRRYDYLENQPFETEYGVASVMRERQEKHRAAALLPTTASIIMFIISPIPLIATTPLDDSFPVIKDASPLQVSMVSLMLAIIAAGVAILVRNNLLSEAYAKLLEEGDYTRTRKQRKNLLGAISAVYWLLTLAIYLGWSIAGDSWETSWIVWPIAAVAFGALITVINAVLDSRQKTK